MQINNEFLGNLSGYLKAMETTAKEMNAPVVRVEKETAQPFEILLYTMLSARTKDEVTLTAFKKLMQKGNNPDAISKMSAEEIRELIKPVGFYKNKAKYVKEMCRIITQKFGSKVPKNIKDLTSLPGVGIKTANIVLARAFGKKVIGVDTHVHRISNRIGIVHTKTPEQSSKLLNEIIERKYRSKFNKILVAFGQTICLPIRPKCKICPIRNVCFRRGVEKHRNIYKNKM